MQDFTCNQNDTPCGQDGACNWVCADAPLKQAIAPSPELYAKVMAYQHEELVHRISRDHSVDVATARDWFKQGLDYLYRAATASYPISPNASADNAWHAFLLYSRDYREFCQGMFGRFIDHCPKAVLK